MGHNEIYETLKSKQKYFSLSYISIWNTLFESNLSNWTAKLNFVSPRTEIRKKIKIGQGSNANLFFAIVVFDKNYSQDQIT